MITTKIREQLSITTTWKLETNEEEETAMIMGYP
jgi:hypothetical protein